MMAAYGGSDAAVRYLIAEHGVGLDSVSVQCFTALMVAAMCGHYDTVQTLLLLGASADVTATRRCCGRRATATATSSDCCRIYPLMIDTCAPMAASQLSLTAWL